MIFLRSPPLSPFHSSLPRLKKKIPLHTRLRLLLFNSSFFPRIYTSIPTPFSTCTFVSTSVPLASSTSTLNSHPLPVRSIVPHFTHYVPHSRSSSPPFDSTVLHTYSPFTSIPTPTFISHFPPTNPPLPSLPLSTYLVFPFQPLPSSPLPCFPLPSPPLSFLIHHAASKAALRQLSFLFPDVMRRTSVIPSCCCDARCCGVML